MRRRAEKVSIDGKSVRDYILKSGDTIANVARSIGVSGVTFNSYLSKAEMPKMAFVAMLAHLGVADGKPFLRETAEAEEARKKEENLCILGEISECKQRLDRLEYINKNICEIIDLLETLNATLEKFTAILD